MRPNADPHSFEISAREAARDPRRPTSSSPTAWASRRACSSTSTRPATTVCRPSSRATPSRSSTTPTATRPGRRDPHFWTDPARMLDVVDGLEAALAEVDGVDAGSRARAGRRLPRRARGLDAEMTEAFAAIPEPQRALVTNHHVFGYLAERFDFRVVGAVIPGGTTLAAPSASDLRRPRRGRRGDRRPRDLRRVLLARPARAGARRGGRRRGRGHRALHRVAHRARRRAPRTTSDDARQHRAHRRRPDLSTRRT